MLKAIVIDDEDNCRTYLNILLEQLCKNVEVKGMAGNVEDAFELIERETPDIVLLDIVLQNRNGFELLEMFPALNFEVIITTAYDQFALQAIKASALDYLLKPVKRIELQHAIDKAVRKIQQKGMSPINRIVVQGDKKKYSFLLPEEIIRIEAKGKKLVFMLSASRKLEVTDNLGNYEDMLDRQGFLRSHRSYIINLQQVVEYMPDRNGGFVRMSDEKLVPVALSKRDEFLYRFSL